MKKIILINLMTTIFFIILALSVQAQEAGNKTENEPEDLQQFLEDGMKEIEFYSLEELLDVEIEVASLFMEDELVVGSMVSSISENGWKQLGARRVTDAIASELSVFVYPLYLGYNLTAIRGYANDALSRGTAYLLDGVPVNDFINGTTLCNLSEFGLGTLERIELIKGPGSAIYGSDAFHGVISMKTFESDKDHYSFELAGAYPLYGDANVKLSHGLGADNLFRLNMAVSTTGQPEQEQDYKYDYPGTIFPPTDPAEGTGTRKTKYQSHTGVLKLKIGPSSKIDLEFGSYINSAKFSGFPGIVMMTSASGGGSLEKFDITGNESLFYMFNGSAAYTFNNNISIETNAYYHTYQTLKTWYTDRYGGKTLENLASDRSGTNIILKQPDNELNLQWLIAYSFTYMKVREAKYEIISLDPLVPSRPEDSQPFEGKSRTMHSPFIQAKWGAIKNLMYLILGGRLDHYSDYGSQFTPRAGLIFLPVKNSSVKALYGRAFRGTSAGEYYGNEPYTTENKDLEPETIDIYELIIMYNDKDLKITLNGYYSSWENGILTGPDFDSYFAGGPPGKRYNSGKNTSYGGELSMFYLFSPYAVDLGLSYTRSTANDVSVSYFTDETEDQDYVAFPEYIARAGLHYNLSQYKTRFFFNNRLCYNMKNTHYNKMVDEEQEPEDLPLYWRMDFNIIKIIDEHSEVTLDIHNLLNRKNRIPSLAGAIDGLEEPGISVMLRAGYKI